MDKYIAVYLTNGVLHTAMRMNIIQQHGAMRLNLTKSDVERKIPDQENTYRRILFL